MTKKTRKKNRVLFWMKYLQLYIVLTRKKWETDQGYTFRPSIRSIRNILIHFLSQFYTSFFYFENSFNFCFDLSYNISRQHFSSFIQDHNQWFFLNAFCNRSSRSLLRSYAFFTLGFTNWSFDNAYIHVI